MEFHECEPLGSRIRGRRRRGRPVGFEMQGRHGAAVVHQADSVAVFPPGAAVADLVAFLRRRAARLRAVRSWERAVTVAPPPGEELGVADTAPDDVPRPPGPDPVVALTAAPAAPPRLLVLSTPEASRI